MYCLKRTRHMSSRVRIPPLLPKGVYPSGQRRVLQTRLVEMKKGPMAQLVRASDC